MQYYIASIVALLICWYVHYLSLSRDISELQSSVKIAETNKMMCNDALESQTSIIEAQRIDYDAKIKAYNEMTPQTRYKVIYRDIIQDINITKEESSCEETKQVINNVRNLDFNAL